MGSVIESESVEIPTENNACVMQKLSTLVWEKRNVPQDPEDFESVITSFNSTMCLMSMADMAGPSVVVAPKKTGICGSDMHVFLEGKVRNLTKNPIVYQWDTLTDVG